jgi:hypothetical protein
VDFAPNWDKLVKRASFRKSAGGVVATPAFLAENEKAKKKVGVQFAIELLSAGKEPSMLIGKPEATEPSTEDQGRTVVISSEFKFYLKRDDHPQDCDCGCGGGAIFTFMLPEDY